MSDLKEKKRGLERFLLPCKYVPNLSKKDLIFFQGSNLISKTLILLNQWKWILFNQTKHQRSNRIFSWQHENLIYKYKNKLSRLISNQYNIKRPYKKKKKLLRSKKEELLLESTKIPLKSHNKSLSPLSGVCVVVGYVFYLKLFGV